MLNLVKKLYYFLRYKSAVPWASFEVGEIGDGGKMQVHFIWNDSFITKLNSIGFKAETEEDTVQLFFYASQMRPDNLSGDSPVQPDSHPQLSSSTNIFKE